MGKKGCLITILIASGIYLGMGKLTLDNIKEQMSSQGEVFMNYYNTYNLINWLPKTIEFLTNHDIVDSLKEEREKRKIVYGLSEKIKNSANNSDREKISSLEHKLNRGEITIQQFESTIQDIGDIYLGQGKTKKIMEISKKGAENGNYSKDAIIEIIDEIPTGLSSEADKFVKGFAKEIIRDAFKKY